MTTNRIKFTKRSLEKLPNASEGRRDEYYDTEIPGLSLRVTPNGTKTFVLRRRIRGRPERITLGRFPGITVEQARKLAQERLGDIAAGKDPAAVRRAQHGELTLGELWDEYLQRHAKPKTKTWKVAESQFKKHLSHWSGRKLSQIDNAAVRRLHARLGQTTGPYGANRVRELLRAMYNRALDWGLFDGKNPAERVDRYPERQRDRYLLPDEAEAFFKALQEEPNPDIRDFFLLALLTGARKSNLLAMRWEEINWESETWRMPETKNADPVIVPLVGQALQILQRRREWHPDNEWVFPSHGKSGHLNDPKAGWKRILKRAGLKNLRIHDLRRSLGSWQAAHGASLLVIGKSLGHKSMQATQVYSRLDLDPVRQSMGRAVDQLLYHGGTNIIDLPKRQRNRAKKKADNK